MDGGFKATMTPAPGITKVWGPALPKRPRWIRGWPKKKQRWDGATKTEMGWLNCY